MAITYNGLFGSNGSKTAGTSLVIDPVDITVATGDDLFMGFYSDDAGSAHGVTHAGSASITWTQEGEEINVGVVKTQLWRGAVTAGGTLQSVTISWTTDVTAKGAVIGWYSGVGTRDDLVIHQTDTGTSMNVYLESDGGWQIGDLVIGACGVESSNGFTMTTTETGTWTAAPTMVGQGGTTGGGSATNVCGNLGHGIADEASASGDALGMTHPTTGADKAAVAGVYSPAAAATTSLQPSLRLDRRVALTR